MLPATSRLINGAENHYCGYCSKLIESFNDITNADDNNVIFCASCQGLFHLHCTALSTSPNKQTLTWKCNSCVARDVELPTTDSQPPTLAINDPINYDEDQLHDLVERRLLSLQHRFANDLQIVSARFTSAELDESDKDECLIITGVPHMESEKLIELVCKLSSSMGIGLTPQRILRCGATEDTPCSFVIKFNSQTTRQFILNNYLNSIMHPIVVPSQSKWQVGGSSAHDSEATSTTCLLPQTSATSGNSPIYMFEYLSPQNQTLLVKSVNSLDPQLPNYSQTSTNVIHDGTSHVNIVPVIKISSAPLIRLASKESFDEFEDNNNNNLPPIQSSASIVSIVSTASVSGSEPGSDGNSENQIVPSEHEVKGKIFPHEKWWHTTLQISIPFFLAGIGTVGAGIILGTVEHWDVFKHIGELFILVPSLLGLKGNLDMCLASRLSTQANLGNMTSKKVILKMIIGNIALVQVQATVAAFTVSLFAIGVGQGMEKAFNFNNAMVVVASAMFTATSSCFVLDFFLIAMVLTSIKLKMNPDNLATPLAASIGDVVSITVFSFIASLLYKYHETHLWTTFLVVIIYFTLLPIWILIVLKNEYTRPVLKSGWVPVMSALFISGLGGLVLDSTIGMFHGFVVFQPIINGIGGNLVSVQASKISTMLHQSSILGIVPPYTKILEDPFKALFKGVPYAKTGRILILMTIPALLFIFVADVMHQNKVTIDIVFIITYWLVSLLQVSLLLYIAHVIIHLMWKHKIDPDNSAIPYLTAVGDLSGTCLLFIAFFFLESVGHGYGITPGTGD